MNTHYSNFAEKFKIDSLSIFETDFWRWSLRPVQVTIGAGILSLKRAEEHFSGITEDESKDLIMIVRVIEKTLTKLFGYQRINYLMLMMVDFQVHYHVIPRYDKEITYIGKTWIDNDWPKPPTVTGTPTDSETLEKLLIAIKDVCKTQE